jgi:ABC-type Fe3+ transport system substrate-binding protein
MQRAMNYHSVKPLGRLGAGATALVLGLGLVACGGGTTTPAAGPANSDKSGAAAATDQWKTLDDLVAAADKEGELSFVGSAVVWGGTTGMQTIQDALNKKYGTNVKLKFLPGPSMTDAATKVIQEVSANQTAFTDILVSPNSGGGSKLYEYSREHPIELFSDLPTDSALTAYDNRSIQIMTDFPGVIYNTDLVKPADVPKTMDELVDPKWKGKASAGSDGALMYYLPFILGEEKAMDYVERYAALKPAFMRCGEDARIASGEYAYFAMSCGEYGVRQLQAKGAPISSRVLNDACIELTWSLLVPKTSKRPALAHLLSGFMATPEGQAAYWEAAKVSDIFHDTPTAKKLKEVEATGAKCLRAGGSFQEENAAEIDRYRTQIIKILG